MMKQEFEERLGWEVPQTEYNEIEFVYTWHPAISDTKGKEQIADIYKAGGMTVINSMKEAAVMAQRINEEIRKEMKVIERLKGRRARLQNGDVTLERCINELETALGFADTEPCYSKMKDILEEKYGIETMEEAKLSIRM